MKLVNGIEVIDIPLNAPVIRDVRIGYLRKSFEPGRFSYLQGVGSGLIKRLENYEASETARVYLESATRDQEELACLIGCSRYDALLSPPTRHPQLTDGYRRAFAAHAPQALDITDRFQRVKGVRSGPGRPLQAVVDDIRYESHGDESAFRKIIIIDDIFATGTTAAAMIHRMRQAGLSDECSFVIACPYWALPSHQTSKSERT